MGTFGSVGIEAIYLSIDVHLNGLLMVVEGLFGSLQSRFVSLAAKSKREVNFYFSAF